MNETTFEKLKDYFGTHKNVADALGISPRQYENWRKGHRNGRAERDLERLCLLHIPDTTPTPRPAASGDSSRNSASTAT